MQAIIISDSLESRPTYQMEPEMEPTGVARIELKEADPVLSALQVIPPSDWDEG